MPQCHFILTLRPVPAGRDHLGRDVAYRLRLALKRLGRDFGLQTVDFRTVDAADGKAAERKSP